MPLSGRYLLSIGLVTLLSACQGFDTNQKVTPTPAAESFDRVIDDYAKLYDKEFVGVSGNEKGVRVVALKGPALPPGSYRPLNQVDDLSVDCHASRAQLQQYDLREYPQVDAASLFESNLSLPTSLSKGLGIVANAGGGSAKRYQVKFESPVALFLPQSEVNKLWSKPACSSKVYQKNSTVALVRGYIYARLTAVVQSESNFAPKVQVFNEDTFSVRYAGNGSWQIADRAAKRYMTLVSMQTFTSDGTISRGEDEPPHTVTLSPPSAKDLQLLEAAPGRYGEGQ